MCTEIVRNKATKEPITVAKAYCYRGEMRHFGIDRRKDFDKAKKILNELDKENLEVKFLKQFIDLIYYQNFRQYLFINTDYKNLFKF